MTLKDNKIVAWSDPVVNQPDRPQIDADKLKAVFDSNSNELKDALNATIDALAEPGGIDLIGVSEIDGIEGTTITEQIKQAVEKSQQELDKTEETLSKKIDEVEEKFDSSGIPKGGVAGQYLKKQSDSDYDMIWDAPAGSGDMLQNVYDKNNNGIVDNAENAKKANEADNAEKLGGEPPSYYAKKAELTGATATGSAGVTIDGVIDGTALTQAEIYGKSVQDGTPSPDVSIPTGKNLLNADAIAPINSPDSVEILEEGYTISVTGSKGYSGCLSRNLSSLQLAGKDIVIKYSATDGYADGAVCNLQLMYELDGNTTYGRVPNNKSGASEIISVPSNAENVRIAFYANNTSTVLTNAVTVTITGLMVCIADETDLTWEPYQGGPVDIESVVADGVNVCGKNLIDWTALRVPGNQGATGNVSENQISVTATGSANGSFTFILPDDLKGKTLSVSFNAVASVPTHTPGILFAFATTSNTSPVIITTIREFGTVVIPNTAPDDKPVLIAMFRVSTSGSASNGDTATFTDIMIVEGEYTAETMPAYEPYTGTTYSITPEITLRGIPVDSGGNYTDENGQQWICDTYDVATGEYVQRVGEYVCTGTETNVAWMTTAQTKSGNNMQLRTVLSALPKQLSTDSNQTGKYSISSHGKTGFVWTGEAFIEAYTSNSGDMGLISIDPSDIADTKDDMLTWLAAQYAAGTPVTVQYALAEPVVTRLNPVYMSAYAPVTNVVADGDIRVEYNNIMGSVKRSPVFITLSKNAWTSTAPYTQSITVSGMTENARPVADVVLTETVETAMQELEAWALVDKIETGVNAITATCYSAPPQTDIQIVLKEMN